MKTPSIPRLPIRSLIAQPRALVRRRTERPIPTAVRRTTMSDFARRGADAAAEANAHCLEVGATANGFSHLFEPERYESVSVIAPQAADAYPGFVPNRPIDLLPTESEHFGVVLCIGVLERIHEPHGFMAEISRTLEPGGQLFLTAPLIIPEPSQPPLPGRHRVGLNYLVETAGLQIEDLIPIERSSSYAVVGRRTRCGDGQRRSDNTGAKNRPV